MTTANDSSYGIAKVTDYGNQILLSNDLTSITSSIGVNGVVTGAGSEFTSDGFKPGAAASLVFDNIDPSSELVHEGQIVVSIATNYFTAADNTSSVSNSSGVTRVAAEYLWAFELSDGTDHGRFYINASNQLICRIHASDTQAPTKVLTSVGKGDFIEVCTWWAGNKWGILIDGATFYVGTRQNIEAGVFHKLILGAQWTGTSLSINGCTLKNLVISRNSPRRYPQLNVDSVGFFGDSFVVALDGTPSGIVSPRYDNNAQFIVEREIDKKGFSVARWIISGNGGDTVTDTGGGDATDLSSSISSFVADSPRIAVIVAGNNDVSIVNDATFENATTGCAANYLKFAEELLWEDYPTNTVRSKTIGMIVTTAGSTIQDEGLSVVSGRLAQVNAIINNLPSVWDASYPSNTGLIEVADFYTLAGGDSSTNVNYQGYWNSIGNIASGGSASPVTANDRHPSSYGHIVLGRAIANAITRLLRNRLMI